MPEDAAQLLDPQIVAILERAANSGASELQTLLPQQARDQYAAGVKLITGTPPEIGAVEDHVIKTSDATLPARLYRPDNAPHAPLPVLIYFHGGGWSFGSIETHDHICRWLCAEARMLVLSVDYRLGPEYKFPAAVNDAIAATRWAANNAEKLGADPAKLCIGGDSAGGNLAAVTTLHARDRGGPAIAFQLLIYPATDMSMSFPSHTAFGDGLRLTRPLMVWSVANYLRNGNDIIDPRASPLLARDHSGLPPALIITAAFDPLRDEGKAYANKLGDAGVAVQYVCVDGVIHGFIGMTGAVDASRRTLKLAGSALRKAMLEPQAVA